MTILYFGIYKPAYTRNLTLIRGLRENGIEVIECNTRDTGNKKYWQLIKNYWQVRKKYNLMIVGFPGHTIMPLAYLLARLQGKKVIFDAFVSLYDSIILDRQEHAKLSLYALKYWLIDFFSSHMADRVLLDAEAHAKYFRREFKLAKEKVIGLLISCNDEIMYPREKREWHDYFLVHFHGTVIPIQGIEYILAAAKILRQENICFNLIGHLKDYQPMMEQAEKWNLQNINFIDFMSYEKLAEHIAEADICLGAFGDPPKAYRCNIFKVVEAMAMKKAVITGDTPAMREFLTDGKDVLFCKMADAKDLAEKILKLKNNSELRNRIAENSHKTYKEKLTPKSIAKELIKILENL